MSVRFINARNPSKRLREEGRRLKTDEVEVAVNKRFLRKLRSPDLTQVMPPQPPKKPNPVLNMTEGFFVVFMIIVAIMTMILGSAGWGIFLVLPFAFFVFYGAFWYATITNPSSERILRDLRR